MQVQLAQLHVWEGQFPPPEAIERYERVLPGAFDRIIAMAEASQRAQSADTKRAHHYAQADTRRGQWLGAATTWTAMGAALGCRSCPQQLGCGGVSECSRDGRGQNPDREREIARNQSNP